MKKIYTYAAVLAGFAVGAVAFHTQIAEAAGHISEHNLAPQVRTEARTYSVPAVQDLSSSSVTAGVDGVIHVRHLTGTSLATVTSTAFIQGPYPAKLKVQLIDGGAASTLACSSLTLVGRNQYGQAITETLVLAETEVKTTKVFEFLSSYSGACTGGTQNADNIRIRVSNEVGLPYRITSENALMSVCVYDLSAVSMICYAPATFVTDLVASSLDFDDGLVDLSISDLMMFRMRPPAGQ
jgi:hypothetical protein